LQTVLLPLILPVRQTVYHLGFQYKIQYHFLLGYEAVLVVFKGLSLLLLQPIKNTNNKTPNRHLKKTPKKFFLNFR